MSLSVRPYDCSDADRWDEFSVRCLQGTLLHTRSFLSYHGEKFIDCSLFIEDQGKCVGLFPAAISPNDASCVISHPGITYGGLLHCGGLRGHRMLTALDKVCFHFQERGLNKLIYKAVPSFYHRAPAQDDLYALFRLNARQTRCDLSCVIDLEHRLPVTERRRRSLKKSLKAGIEVVEGHQYLRSFWEVLAANLDARYGVEPVHSLDEILLLADRFPDSIRCVCAQLSGQIVAGILVFVTPTTHHAQYIGSNELGYKGSALDAVFDSAIQSAANDGRRWFDFGISNEDQGKVLNDGLYRFKSEFGGGGAVHEFFDLDLNRVVRHGSE